MFATAYPHIEINAKGQACIDGTRTRVLDIVLDRLAHHWDAEAIRRQHPHLSLSQIHSAFAYYYDHREEIDGLISERLRTEQDLLAQLDQSPVMARLRKLKAERGQSA